MEKWNTKKWNSQWNKPTQVWHTHRAKTNMQYLRFHSMTLHLTPHHMHDMTNIHIHSLHIVHKNRCQPSTNKHKHIFFLYQHQHQQTNKPNKPPNLPTHLTSLTIPINPSAPVGSAAHSARWLHRDGNAWQFVQLFEEQVAPGVLGKATPDGLRGWNSELKRMVETDGLKVVVEINGKT